MQEEQILNYFKHTLLTWVIKIVLGHAFFTIGIITVQGHIASAK
jgi:hypothetical protein